MSWFKNRQSAPHPWWTSVTGYLSETQGSQEEVRVQTHYSDENIFWLKKTENEQNKNRKFKEQNYKRLIYMHMWMFTPKSSQNIFKRGKIIVHKETPVYWLPPPTGRLVLASVTVEWKAQTLDSVGIVSEAAAPKVRKMKFSFRF